MVDHKPHCHSEPPVGNVANHAHGRKPDYLFRFSLTGVILAYSLWWLLGDGEHVEVWYGVLAHSVFELINTIWWGVVLGIVMIGLLSRVPREFVIAMLGSGKSGGGIFRATAAGVLLDLCSHGILMVGAKLYERGASAGQVMAFLIASPWNSFSFTLVLIALVGLSWTLVFVALSAVIAVITGFIFDSLVRRGHLPANPNRRELPEDFQFWPQAKAGLRQTRFDRTWWSAVLRSGLSESRMVLRWILFGVLLASLIRSLMSADQMQAFFGPTLAGLALTLLVATLLEVCSEGSSPIAADLLTKANAPGNSFTFLMAGVATDYTEIMVLRDTTRSWRIPLMLPLITLPQILLLGWLLNQWAVG